MSKANCQRERMTGRGSKKSGLSGRRARCRLRIGALLALAQTRPTLIEIRPNGAITATRIEVGRSHSLDRGTQYAAHFFWGVGDSGVSRLIVLRGGGNSDRARQIPRDARRLAGIAIRPDTFSDIPT